MTGKQISTWTAVVIGTGTVIGLALWGVPTYIEAKVHNLYVAEAKAAPAPSIPVAVGENTAAVKALGRQLTSMEDRMIARDQIQAQRDQTQADRDAVIMAYFANKASGK